MKTIYTITIFLSVCLSSLAQNYVDLVIWKAEAKSGGVFVGLSEDLYEAENAIDELKFDKEGTKYAIVSKETKISRVRIKEGSDSAFEDFKSDHEYLTYKYISEIELISLEYIVDDNLQMAVTFYKNVSRTKNESIIKKHLSSLLVNYSKYLFETETPADLVTMSGAGLE